MVIVASTMPNIGLNRYIAGLVARGSKVAEIRSFINLKSDLYSQNISKLLY